MEEIIYLRFFLIGGVGVMVLGEGRNWGEIGCRMKVVCFFCFVDEDYVGR